MNCCPKAKMLVGLVTLGLIGAAAVVAAQQVAATQDPPAKQSPMPPTKPKNARAVEDAVRAVAAQYFIANVLGDIAMHKRVTRVPLQTIRDGKTGAWGEAEVTAHLSTAKQRFESAKLPATAKQDLFKNVIEAFDMADIQFLGASTAIASFITKPGKNPSDGDHVGGLVIHKGLDGWKVIAEITDSLAVPPSYLEPVPLPPVDKPDPDKPPLRTSQ